MSYRISDKPDAEDPLSEMQSPMAAYAAANKLLGSLWSIPDKQTLEFMIQFCANLLEGQAAHEAVRNIQLEFSQKYPPF